MHSWPPRSLFVPLPDGMVASNFTGGPRRHAIAREMLHPTGTGNKERFFRVRNPSARLRLFVSVVFEPDDGSDFTSDASGFSQWTAVARARDALTGRSAPIDSIMPPLMPVFFGPRPLPDGWEADSSLAEIRFDCKLADNGVNGVWWAQATWEPNETMPREELVELINQCALEVEGSPTLFN